VRNTWRRAGALSGTLGRLAVMAAAAALLLAAMALPVIGIAGVAARDAANTFDNLPVGTLGSAPTRSVLYDAEGQPFAYFYPNNIYRVPVPYQQIAPVMRNAIVSIEDDNFYHEGAFDLRGTLRAIVSDLDGSQVQGASTLAQQYVKNVRVLLARTPEQQQAAVQETFERKIEDLLVAARVEHQMTLHDLLASYLNVAYFNNDAWGVQVAAEVYFSEPASKLTLTQAALLAGIVQSPTEWNPVAHPDAARFRRNEVLGRMADLHYITAAAAKAAENSPIVLHMSAAPLHTGCTSPQVAQEAFFCDYVQHVLEINYPSVWRDINTTGGLQIYTTMDMRDQVAAENAVNYVMPAYGGQFNPNHNADTEVLITPGTGAVRAIAVDRKFGDGPGEDDIDYAVNSEYGGGIGVQTGSSSKIFTLIAALKQGVPFGQKIKVVSPTVVGPYYNCQGGFAGDFPVANDGQILGSTTTAVWPLYSATVSSINVYFAHLEQMVGLCNVVRTAVDMGMTRADGRSLLQADPSLGGNGEPADDVPSFTLGSVAVSPMSMAAAYASVAAGGWYCAPKAITKIVIPGAKDVPMPADSCHRDMSQGVAAAANYILQGVLNNPLGTAYGHATRDDEAAKTGTADNGYYAAFAGYTPTLASYTSVFNPTDPDQPAGQMIGVGSCYHEVADDVPDCPGQMFGDNAPRATWQETFMNAWLGPDIQFGSPPSYFFSEGSGEGGPVSIAPPKKPSPGKPGGPGSPPGHHGQPPTPPF
jgi:membrane peptidoglycan carboxypeptidase